LKTALEKLQKYSAQSGGKWLVVSPLLEKLVAEGKGFAKGADPVAALPSDPNTATYCAP
jgi:hypothetical protein